MTGRGGAMLEVGRLVLASPEAVFDVLSDGWTYPAWVVGTSRVHHVDPDWPAVGARIQHSVGAWPWQVRDITRVCAVEPGRLLALDVRLSWLGRAVVRFTVDGRAEGTRVGMAEEAVRGPAGLIPAPVQNLLWRPRNIETLSRLADLVQGRSGVDAG